MCYLHLFTPLPLQREYLEHMGLAHEFGMQAVYMIPQRVQKQAAGGEGAEVADLAPLKVPRARCMSVSRTIQASHTRHTRVTSAAQAGLIYRDVRLTNWCCALRSGISDIEVRDVTAATAAVTPVAATTARGVGH